MPASIEKNDVDISKLFNWGLGFPIQDDDGKELFKVYIRLVGDAELNRARVFALRKSAELRRQLKKEDSDERLAFIPFYELVEKEELVQSLLLFNTKFLTSEALREVKVTMKKEPDSDATLEEQEEYQAWVDNYPKEREAKIREYVQERVGNIEKELMEKDKETLYKDFERAVTDQLCENEMMLKYRDMCAYLGSYKDKEYKELFFKDFGEFENLPKNIKDQFLESYLSLEIGGEDLKKLLEAMQ